MRMLGLPLSLAIAVALTGAYVAPLAAPAAVRVTAHQGANHTMRYLLALPIGWTKERSWPVLVVIPDAGRAFAADLDSFIAARGDRPYVLVAPEVLTCGGARSRTPEHYTYSLQEWAGIVKGDDFAFDDAGLGAVLTNVQRVAHGEPRAFLTGWEADCHTVWEQALKFPQRWRGVAPVTPNYPRRGLADADFSADPARTPLPIQVLRCGASAGDGAEVVPFADTQSAAALADARAHGFTPAPMRVVPGAAHGPLPRAVLAWCDSVRSR